MFVNSISHDALRVSASLHMSDKNRQIVLLLHRLWSSTTRGLTEYMTLPFMIIIYLFSFCFKGN